MRKPAAYMLNFFITVMLFALVNIIDFSTGRADPKDYPFMLYLIFTFVVSSFLYMGWMIAYFINAILLYGLSVISIIHHPESNSVLSWLFGTLPNEWLFLAAAIFLTSLVVQLFVFFFTREMGDGS